MLLSQQRGTEKGNNSKRNSCLLLLLLQVKEKKQEIKHYLGYHRWRVELNNTKEEIMDGKSLLDLYWMLIFENPTVLLIRHIEQYPKQPS